MRPRMAAFAAALALFLATAPPSARPAPLTQPNIVLIFTDDQSPDTIPRSPAVMPKLQGHLEDPSDEWIQFSNAFDNDPLCCPSRSTVLSGQYPHHTGVTSDSGAAFKDGSSVATWLHGAGYWTGLYGKYFNGYPFNRAPYVPPGWDRWAAQTGGDAVDYYNYTMYQCPQPGTEATAPSCVGQAPSLVSYGSAPADYLTDVESSQAVQFVQQAPTDHPFFLYFAPLAPHEHHIVAPGYQGHYKGIAPTINPDLNEADVSDKPAWIRGLPLLTSKNLASLQDRRRRQFEQLLSVDDAVQSLLDAVAARGQLENTVFVYLTDNGYSYGEHRWNGKKCAYRECVRTPFFVRYPGATAHVDPRLVSTVDIAPTFAELAGVTPPLKEDGMSLVPLLDGVDTTWRTAVLLELRGSADVMPKWWAVETADYLYVELATGEKELYDLSGANGPADPWELQNRAGDPAYASVQADLAATLAALDST